VLTTDKSHDSIVVKTKTRGIILVLAPVQCPHCGSGNVKKNGTSNNGKQRFLACNEKCPHNTVVEQYTYNAYDPNIRSRIFFLIGNGSGTRAAARTWRIGKDTVTDALRSIEALVWYGNDDYLNRHRNSDSTVEVVPVTEAERGSFIRDQNRQYGLWWALDHTPGEGLWRSISAPGNLKTGTNL
jgi:transposase-like protein